MVNAYTRRIKIKRIDRSGQRFGKLTVIETIYRYEGNKRSVHRCMCDCGKEVIVSNTSIKKTNSCGCYRIVDHSGKKFGKLTVIEMLPKYKNGVTYCRCACDCGNENYITRSNGIITGNTTSCGCIHSPSLIGQHFGKLSVIKETETINHQRRWECLCECGQIRVYSSHVLKSGHTKSCGCLRSEKTSTREALISELLNNQNIEHIREATFDDCVGIKKWKLRFDFYLPSLKTIIEYDGMQHFRPIEYFGGEEHYKRLMANDEIKNTYCKNNNINLIRLPYTLSDSDIKNKISKISKNPVTTTVA